VIPNIGPRGQRSRFRLGVVAFGAAALLAVVLFSVGAPRPSRLILFLPAWIGALGVVQARAKT
jgi:hypothetical protein